MRGAASTRRVSVQKVNKSRIWSTEDLLVVEEPLEIRLVFERSGRMVVKSASITMRTPGHDFELAAGFFFTEGIIHSRDQIKDIDYDFSSKKRSEKGNVVNVYLCAGVQVDTSQLLRHFYTTSSCGVCGKSSLEALQIRGCPEVPFDRPLVSGQLLRELPQKTRDAQSIFEKTGALHGAALFDASGKLISVREDVGRHNAVDKSIGEQLLANRLPLHQYLMVVSGRASFEVLQKALAAGLPFIVAVGAPSSLAVQLARDFDLTLVGFAREDRFNIYAGAHRVCNPPH